MKILKDWLDSLPPEPERPLLDVLDGVPADTQLPLCAFCISQIGGACAGPDMDWRPMHSWERCGAADHKPYEGREFVPAYLGGRCANGAQRDAGTLVHAIPNPGEGAGGIFGKALCGARPGGSSYGFSVYEDLDRPVTCKRCARKASR